MEASTISSLNIFKGKKVFGTTGNECGIIKDFLLDPNSLGVKFIVISEGNLSSKHYYIAPFGAMNFESPYAAQHTLNMPLEKLLSVPNVPKSGNSTETTSLYEKIAAYYGEDDQVMIYRDADQTYEGSSQITGDTPSENSRTSDDVAYDNFKKREGEVE